MIDWGKYAVVSFYMANIPQEVRLYQAKVFERFGVPLQQLEIKVDRPMQESDIIGQAYEQYVEQNKDRVEYFMFWDIDAIPLNKEALEFYHQEITSGNLVGPAQRSNHIENNKHAFCAPCALGFSRETYKTVKDGSLNSLFRPSARGDTAEEFTYRAEFEGEDITILVPTHCEELMWPLRGDKLEYGEGTTYGVSNKEQTDVVYHAFNSRHKKTAQRFVDKCREVLGYGKQPLFTVVMPVSRGDYGKALDSILGQDYTGDVQVLIVHDGPKTDDGLKLLEKSGNTTIENMYLPYNSYTAVFSSTGGIPRCIGSALAKGKYVCFLDDDCRFKPNHLSSLAKVIEEQEPYALFTLRDLYNQDGEFLTEDNFESLGPEKGISGGLIDTNCLCVKRHDLWNTFSGWLCPQRAEDRWMVTNILANGVEIVGTGLSTVEYKLPEYLVNNSGYWAAQKNYLNKG